MEIFCFSNSKLTPCFFFTFFFFVNFPQIFSFPPWTLILMVPKNRFSVFLSNSLFFFYVLDFFCEAVSADIDVATLLCSFRTKIDLHCSNFDPVLSHLNHSLPQKTSKKNTLEEKLARWKRGGGWINQWWANSQYEFFFFQFIFCYKIFRGFFFLIQMKICSNWNRKMFT